jgi:hypothetical protein
MAQSAVHMFVLGLVYLQGLSQWLSGKTDTEE